ncbi:MAG TPA: MmcQ/YjbR family DNA-binding protein [Longimicrobium sp.]
MSDDELSRVRRICLALPEATEQVAWGEPTWRVRKKLFAMFAGNHHNDGRIALWCNAPLGVQEHLVRTEPEKYFVPPYVGVKGWIGIMIARASDEEIASLVLDAYCMVAPKRLQAQV